MEFLLGLDMLKRHRCSIDLAEGKLFFHGVGGRRISTPFLHEHALPESKGGTKGYNPNLVPAEDVTDADGAGAGASASAAGSSSGAAAGGSGGNAFDVGIVETLIALGHTRERVIEALQQTNGDAELAKTVLMFGGGR
jgi:DNA damage-inducible protein 1